MNIVLRKRIATTYKAELRIEYDTPFFSYGLPAYRAMNKSVNMAVWHQVTKRNSKYKR